MSAPGDLDTKDVVKWGKLSLWAAAGGAVAFWVANSVPMLQELHISSLAFIIVPALGSLADLIRRKLMETK